LQKEAPLTPAVIVKQRLQEDSLVVTIEGVKKETKFLKKGFKGVGKRTVQPKTSLA
jgi:hypothetical protein